MKVLVFAPHPDDEIIGVGGTIAKRIKEGHEVYVCIVTSGQPPIYRDEDTVLVQNEARAAHKMLGVRDTIFLNYPAVMLETVPRYIFNEGISEVVQRIEPNEVYIPHRGDMQIDHKMVVDACMVALRPKYQHRVSRIYAYETLSETGWDIPNTVNEFIPTVYENISEHIEAKLEAMKQYQSQLAPFPNARSLESIRSLAMYRGATVNCPAAEAFSLIREIK